MTKFRHLQMTVVSYLNFSHNLDNKMKLKPASFSYFLELNKSFAFKLLLLYLLRF